MRSRLEAEVASILDGRGDRWVYEPMCFADESGQYLPDFGLLDDVGAIFVYVEVKPLLPTFSLRDVRAQFDRMKVIRSSLPEATFVVIFINSDRMATFWELPSGSVFEATANNDDVKRIAL